MPRTNDISKLRRIAMQVVMWIILAGTVGLAALVNAHAARTRGALGEPVTLGGSLRVQLPKSWTTITDEESLIEVAEVAADGDAARALRVEVRPRPSMLESLFSGALRNTSNVGSETFRAADQDWTAEVRQRRLRNGAVRLDVTSSTFINKLDREVVIELNELISGRDAEVAAGIDLVKRVAATVRIGEKPE